MEKDVEQKDQHDNHACNKNSDIPLFYETSEEEKHDYFRSYKYFKKFIADERNKKTIDADNWQA